MMRKFLIPLIVGVLLVSCQYGDIVHGNTFRAGTYKGQLVLLSGFIDYAPTSLTMTFTPSRYSIESPQFTFNPCNSGTYKIVGQGIELTSDCTQQSEILNGEFQLNVSGRHVEFTKSTGATTVTYDLILQ